MQSSFISSEDGGLPLGLEHAKFAALILLKSNSFFVAEKPRPGFGSALPWVGKLEIQ